MENITHKARIVPAEILHIFNPNDLEHVANLIVEGQIIIIAFNGVYGIFGDADNEDVAKKILEIKCRPQDKNLVLVCLPEYLNEFVDENCHTLERYPL